VIDGNFIATTTITPTVQNQMGPENMTHIPSNLLAKSEVFHTVTTYKTTKIIMKHDSQIVEKYK
jgi:hypothetical protein